jgi:uncharacterized protein DUF6458
MRTSSSAPTKESQMGISVSLLLVAVGAILTWAVTAEASGVDINTVGVILMVVGLAGLALSLVFWSSWGGLGTSRNGATTTVVHDRVERDRTAP